MPSISPRSDWNRLKPDTIHAVRELLAQLYEDGAGQDLLDSYLYAKRLLADSMQALIRMDLPSRCETFHEMREDLREEISRRYDGRIPAAYLTVPYGSRVHEELFTILLERQGQPVSAALLRVVTADSVHAERRTRELRELGFQISTGKANGSDVYTLESLELDTSMVPTIVKNIRRDKKITQAEEHALTEVLGL